MTVPQKTPRKTKAPTIGRPALAKGAARVVLTAERVAPATLAKINRLKLRHGGRGRVLDAAVALLPE